MFGVARRCADISDLRMSFVGWRRRFRGGTTCAGLVALCLWVGCQRMAPTSPPEAQLAGTVVAEGVPLAGARVRIKGQTKFVETDASGRFDLPFEPSAEQKLQVTAAKPDFIIAGADVGDEPLRIDLSPLPTEDDVEYRWVDPRPDPSDAQRCGNCHEEIFDQWQGGGHARSATDPRFLDLYAGIRSDTGELAGWGLLSEHPDGAGVCASCHAPAADLSQLGIGDLRDIHGVAQLGVHCDFCHKINDVDLSALGLTHGRFATSLLRPAEDQLFFGPLDDVDRGEDSYLPLQSTSQYCATCHEGIVFGVPVYSTYSEWLASQAAATGKQCQDCHMKPNGKMTNIARGFGGIERHPATLASHDLLPGGHVAMLRQCLDVEVVSTLQDDRTSIHVTTRTHDVGHRVPTGFVDRHLVLVVEGQTADGETVRLQKGPVLPSFVGEISGVPGVLFAKLLVDEDGNAPVPFWRAGATVKDTRLHPDAERTDEFEYHTGIDQVRVRLLYRKFWPTVAAEKGWPDETIVVYDETHDVPTTVYSTER